MLWCFALAGWFLTEFGAVTKLVPSTRKNRGLDNQISSKESQIQIKFICKVAYMAGQLLAANESNDRTVSHTVYTDTVCYVITILPSTPISHLLYM